MTTTRWWWVRHAPVINPDNLMYGQMDLPCDCGNAVELAHLADMLPVTPNWYISPLQRTRQTAQAILQAPSQNAHDQPVLTVIPDFIEQGHDRWEGGSWQEFYAARNKPMHPFWPVAADERMGDSETFIELCARVHAQIDELTARHQGEDIIMVGHGGPIRAAVGHALGLDAERALRFQILNLSLSRIDYRVESGIGYWRVVALNRTLGPLPIAYEHLNARIVK